jgi:hypothetical protein
MPTTYHRSAYTGDPNGLRLCPHAHTTVISAVACITSAGEYVVAQEDGVFRALNQTEEAEYQFAIYGAAPNRRFAPMEGYRKKQFT